MSLKSLSSASFRTSPLSAPSYATFAYSSFSSSLSLPVETFSSLQICSCNASTYLWRALTSRVIIMALPHVPFMEASSCLKPTTTQSWCKLSHVRWSIYTLRNPCFDTTWWRHYQTPEWTHRKREIIIINEICHLELQQYYSGERNLPHSTFSLTLLRTVFTMLEMLLNKPQMG